MMRENIVLFGDSLTEQSFRVNGWGASLANAYSRKLSFFLLKSNQIRSDPFSPNVLTNKSYNCMFQADILVRGYGGYNTRWALFLLHHLFPLESTKPPLATTIFFGANDAALSGRTSERQHVPIQEFKHNLQKTILHLKVQFFISFYVLLS